MVFMPSGSGRDSAGVRGLRPEPRDFGPQERGKPAVMGHIDDPAALLDGGAGTLVKP
jgi:hypothetical protein